MTLNLAKLKKNSKSNFDKLKSEVSNLSNNKFNNTDDTFWTLTVDKAENGYAVIRFLPAIEGEDAPYIRYWDHGFKGPGGWYIEKSMTTIGEDDPVSEYNTKLWNSGIESNKDVARAQKRQQHFVSNILVIKDPANPDNEGKVFKYRYGKKIFDMINGAMNPPEGFEDEQPLNPFDLLYGANFKIKATKVDGFRNYSKSSFAEPTIAGTDDSAADLSDDDLEKYVPDLEKIVSQCYSLSELIEGKTLWKGYTNPTTQYNILKKKLEKVLGKKIDIEEKSVEEQAVDDEFGEGLDDDDDKDDDDKQEDEKPVENEKADESKDDDDDMPFDMDDDDDDDDAMAFFDKIAKD